MITSWSYGVNALPQWKLGSITLREEPWWLALCGWTIDQLGYECRCLHWIKMPRWLKVVDKDDGEVMSWRDYYGDLGSLYHIYIYNPLFHWHIAHPKSKMWDVELGYDKVKELFGERDKELFAKQEEGVGEKQC